MLDQGIGSIEIHLYGTGLHGDGMRDRNGASMGMWKDRFIDWFRYLGFLDPNRTGEQIGLSHVRGVAAPLGARNGNRDRPR